MFIVRNKSHRWIIKYYGNLLQKTNNKLNDMLNVKTISFCITGLLISFYAYSQEGIIRLSLDDAIKRAEENNWQINKSKAQGKVAKFDFRQTNSLFLPDINLSHSVIATNDPLMAFGFKLKQEIVGNSDFNPVLLNDPGRIENFTTKVEVKQPLINVDGFYARKAAKEKMRAVDYQTERAINYTKYEVKKAYYQLELTKEAIEVVKKSYEMAKSASKLTEDNLKQGYVKEADLLSAKVRVFEIENQLSEATNNYKMAQEYLAFLLGFDINTEIETTDVLNTSPVVMDNISEGNNLIDNRSDILAYKNGVEARKSMLRSSRFKFLPRLNAFGQYEWNDDKLLGNNAENYMLGASLSWNIFSGYRNIAKVQKAKAELRIAGLDYDEYLQKSKMEIESAKRNVAVAFKKLQTSRLAKEQAKESLRIRMDRYKQGLEKTTDLLFSETVSSARNLSFIKSVYDYHIAVFQLEFLLEKKLK